MKYPVGTSDGKFDVSAIGSGTYALPLISPPSTMGMGPNLSVNYNSLAGNGLMGIGWSLSGSCISSITRGKHDYFYGNQVSPVMMNNSDWFLLDGQHLITSFNGANQAVYKTEIENYSLITSHGQTGGGPSYFTVQSKNGYIMEYGRTSDSYIEGKGTNTAMTWLLNKVTDSNNNYYTISYFEDNLTGEYRIDHIDYTGNDLASISPYNQVKFIYRSRSDKQLNYFVGYPIAQPTLLVGVDMWIFHTS